MLRVRFLLPAPVSRFVCGRTRACVFMLFFFFLFVFVLFLFLFFSFRLNEGL